MSEYKDIEFKEVERKKKVRKKKNYLLRFGVFIGVIAAAALFLSSSFFDVKTIEVDGNGYYDAEEVRNLAVATTGNNIFWGGDARAIEDNLLKDPYFEEVSVRRKLPSTLVIEVKERTQIAAIVYGEQYVVIDKDGLVLRKSKVDPKITLLTGLTISKLSLGEKVEAEEASALKTTLTMLHAMQNGDVYFKRIDVSSIVLRAYIYDTLVVKGTAKQILNGLESGDLQKVINNLLKSDTTRGTIHLGEHNYMPFSPEFE